MHFNRPGGWPQVVTSSTGILHLPLPYPRCASTILVLQRSVPLPKAKTERFSGKILQKHPQKGRIVAILVCFIAKSEGLLPAGTPLQPHYGDTPLNHDSIAARQGHVPWPFHTGRLVVRICLPAHSPSRPPGFRFAFLFLFFLSFGRMDGFLR